MVTVAYVAKVPSSPGGGTPAPSPRHILGQRPSPAAENLPSSDTKNQLGTSHQTHSKTNSPCSPHHSTTIRDNPRPAGLRRFVLPGSSLTDRPTSRSQRSLASTTRDRASLSPASASTSTAVPAKTITTANKHHHGSRITHRSRRVAHSHPQDFRLLTHDLYLLRHRMHLRCTGSGQALALCGKSHQRTTTIK
jgi:hypothetical protein